MSISKKFMLIILLITLSNFAVFSFINDVEINSIPLFVEVYSNTDLDLQLFYNSNNTEKFTEEQSLHHTVTKNKITKFYWKIPIDCTQIRLDYGNTPANIVITKMYFQAGKKSESIINKLISNETFQNQNLIIENNKKIQIKTTGDDPYSVISISDLMLYDWSLQNLKEILLIKKIICVLMINSVLGFLYFQIDRLLLMLKSILQNKKLLFQLAKNDFKKKYVGSMLGIIWAFIQPISTILIYWFVFSVGLKAGSPVENVPFLFWFVLGLVPWFFFQEAVINALNCMSEYSYLVKKVVFQIDILPLIKIISSFFIHIVFILIVILIGILYGFIPNIYFLQLPYYIFCIFILALGISYITSSVSIFFRDLGQIINILLQIGMWATPIMWSYDVIPERFQWIEKLNPLFYIVDGYRSIYIKQHWFWENSFQMFYFWIISIFLLLAGVRIFHKLKPHFADVL